MESISTQAAADSGGRVIFRCTWIPADHFAPDHRDFWAPEAADHYADIQRQLGARDVGVTSFEESK